MSLTKEECEKALFIINVLGKYEDGSPALLEIEQPEEYEIIKQLIEEHFDNPPLKFEELKPDMWVWDNEYKEWCYIYFIAGNYPHRKYINNLVSDGKFEENRFYRR